MAKDYGTGVSRVLDPSKTQFTNVIWQQNKPPLDSELSLISDISESLRRQVVSRGTPSGWLGNGTNDAKAYVTDPSWSNWFRFGQQATGEQAAIQWAVVNGWVVPVTGTQTGTPPGSPDDASTWNRVTLSPPPSNSGDSRVDFVFLEVWQALLPPNPSATNKPAASSIYKYGNVEGGMSYLPDTMVDPAIGFETTQRVQVQYRVRVVTGLVGLQSFPDGFDPANVKARGTSDTDTSFTFTNMRKELGDPGLWRAGNGTSNALGTVDGYSYAIPLAVVFRRNSVAWDGDPGQNLNGGFNRNPTAIDRTGWTTFMNEPVVAAVMTASQLTLSLDTATAIALPASPSTPVTIQVGDEIMTYSNITGTTVTLTARGQLGTKAEAHAVGEPVRVFSGRPDGLFSDQIVETDILDLRHVVSPGGFDYQSMLHSNLDKLLKGQLRANWKRSSSTQGAYLFYQDKVSASPAALGVSKLDAPDGLRQIWSDACIAQSLTLIARPPTAASASESIDTAWGFPFSGNTCDNSGGSVQSFKDNAVLTIPIAQFKNTVPGSDQDQVSFPTRPNTAADPWVTIRVAGSSADLDPDTDFSVVAPTGPDDDLIITLTTGSEIYGASLHITLHVLYGPGRGLSRRPSSVHSVAFLNSSAGTYLRQRGQVNNNIPVSVGWAPLWSKFRAAELNGMAPVTAEAYVDPGSKTLILSPFRQLDLPDNDTTFIAQKNDAVNGGAGVLPDSGDPLGMFSTGSDTVAKRNSFVVLPRTLIPGYGDVYAPIIHTDSGNLVEGINFGFHAPKGNLSSGVDQKNNFVAYNNTEDSKSFATFTTVDLTTAGTTNVAAPYNGLTPSIAGATPAGMRFFTDTSGRGRTGLELPKYMGPARIFAVYEAEDFAVNGSAYDSLTRVALGTGATNLLRQSIDGPTMWITLDSDGDSTFVLNSEAIDISKSPNAVSTFESGHYVLEMSTFGFDRGFFDLTQEARLVLPRLRSQGLDPAGADARLNSTGVSMVVPAPPVGSDSIAVNFSRVPYSGDAFGSQSNMLDMPQRVGPLTSGEAYQIGYLELDQANLTRPNQKVAEVLASASFITTLGTGRLAGDYDPSQPTVNLRNPGYQDASTYPPSSAVADRPLLEVGGVFTDVDTLLSLGTDYHGCVEHLPLGALHRSFDFRGESIYGQSGVASGVNPSPLQVLPPAPGVEATKVSGSPYSAPVYTATQASGGPDVLVHVDGESSNYANLTNYRTARGGSAFVASGPRAGGELAGVLGSVTTDTTFNSVLAGTAYLVRLAPTSLGATEVSAGSEIALIVATTATRKHPSKAVPIRLLCSTSGSGEGFSAADLFRVEGRPLAVDSVRVNINPSDIELVPATTLKPRIGG